MFIKHIFVTLPSFSSCTTCSIFLLYICSIHIFWMRKIVQFIMRSKELYQFLIIRLEFMEFFSWMLKIYWKQCHHCHWTLKASHTYGIISIRWRQCQWSAVSYLRHRCRTALHWYWQQPDATALTLTATGRHCTDTDSNRTPLHWYCQQPDTIALILTATGHHCTDTVSNRTPLHWYWQQPDTTALILAATGRHCTDTDSNRTPLH
jgi:hypothetical protein